MWYWNTVAKVVEVVDLIDQISEARGRNQKAYIYVHLNKPTVWKEQTKLKVNDQMTVENVPLKMI